MKIDMSEAAVTRRLQVVGQLRKICLSLADSDAGQKIRRQHPANLTVLRTAQAMCQRPTCL